MRPAQTTASAGSAGHQAAAGTLHARAIADPSAVCVVCITGRHGSCTGWARPLFGHRRTCHCRTAACAARRARAAAAVALLLMAVVPFAAGCAAGVVGADASLRGVAIGHAKLEHCRDTPWPGVPWEAPSECQRIEGGALSVGGWEVLGTLAAGAAAYISGGVLP